jgi:stage V sporulation protein R
MPSLYDFIPRIEALARDLGLAYLPVDFELVPESFMLEIAVYGLPVRMPHWSFGVRYIHQLIRHGMGHSRIFEVMFPGDPCHAFLVDTNTLPENVLVVAHVLGHADFARNNELFARSMAAMGGRILEKSAARAHRIESAVAEFGRDPVERVVDAALALEAHIDTNQPLDRPPYATPSRGASAVDADPFRRRYRELPGEAAPALPAEVPLRPIVPPQPEYDLLWFIAHYAPEMAGWERDVFLAVREESFYFHPVFACQIMNEGWASYWHARLLREADFLPQDLYVSAIKAHSDVVRPYAAEREQALAVNPYHLGLRMWEQIIEREGLEAARRICREEDDFGFVRNHLDRGLAEALDLFVYEADRDGAVRLATRDVHAVREAILAPRFNFGAPRVAARSVGIDGSLELIHDHASDGRGLDRARAERVLDYICRVWRRPVRLTTVDEHGREIELCPSRR